MQITNFFKWLLQIFLSGLFIVLIPYFIGILIGLFSTSEFIILLWYGTIAALIFCPIWLLFIIWSELNNHNNMLS